VKAESRRTPTSAGRQRGDPRRQEFTIGGRRAVTEAIRAGRARRVFVAQGAHQTEGLGALLVDAERLGVPVERVDGVILEGFRVPDYQGVVAQVDAPVELDERALFASPLASDALVVVLDGITDPQNLGACGRSAEAAGASMLIARKHRAAPLTPAAVRASAGALLHLSLARVANIARTLERLKEQNVFVVGLDHRAEVSFLQAPPPGRPLAVVLGSESTGLSRLVKETCDLLISIPLAGRTESLNASTALAVALFAYAIRPLDG
jgi:23S rRNA (guanosine2251-2'-O)-methyltransferase